MTKKIKTSGVVDKAAFRYLLTAAVPNFAPLSNAQPRFFILFVAIFLHASSELVPKLLKN